MDCNTGLTCWLHAVLAMLIDHDISSWSTRIIGNGHNTCMLRKSVVVMA